MLANIKYVEGGKKRWSKRIYTYQTNIFEIDNIILGVFNISKYVIFFIICAEKIVDKYIFNS